jgi:putative flippase GtrA
MYALYLFLLYVGMPYNWALVCDYVGGILLGFTLHKKITFGHRGKVVTTFSKYVASYVFVFLANLALLNLFVLSQWMGAEIGQLMAFGLVTVCIFLIQKNWVFKPKIS